MNQTTRTILIVTSAVVAGAVLLLGGMYIGRSAWAFSSYTPGIMMAENFAPITPGFAGSQPVYQVGPGMMGSSMMGSSMMGSGMMGSGMMGSGMMGGLESSGLLNVDPLSVAEAQQAVQEYLVGINNPDLALGEIMVFDNHAYAQIVEKSTGIGAMELLIDPVTKAVYPEHGPNMMWNLGYSPMSAVGMMGMMAGSGQNFRGMMGDLAQDGTREEISAEMPVSPDRAGEIAQEYLDIYLAGSKADDHADAFYGYYTLHILRDGEVVGMLSVNGFTGQVLPHTWHGDFIEMAEGSHD